MALDGIVLSNIVSDFTHLLLDGRIDKIYQPESDEIIFSIRNQGSTYKVLMTAHSNHPRIHITEKQKNNPASPPMFCMLLRKHLSGGKLIGIIQPNFERIIELHIEGLNEMGDRCLKKLIIEIMGRHSNIILTDEQNKILDSIKHISKDKSSVREVLPGKTYILPPSQGKYNPLDIHSDTFFQYIQGSGGVKIQKAIYQSYSGISPIAASEICCRAGIDASTYLEELTPEDKKKIADTFCDTMTSIKQGNFKPQIVFHPSTDEIIEFSSIDMTQFVDYKIKGFLSISKVLEFYYYERDRQSRVKQKSHDIRKLIQNNLERCYKKKDLQLQQLKKVANREKYRIYGELITANIYSIPKSASTFTTINFYDEDQKEITIGLDPTLTPAQNAQKYFRKYNKEKRTEIALTEQLKQTNEEINYLESLLTALESSMDESDISDIRTELMEQGYMRRKKEHKSKKTRRSKPLHILSSDHFDIFVGKNNRQNDDLTLRFASPTDLWFHTKDIPGSHVIIQTNNKEVPESTILEAALLAAYYSKAKNSSNVPVDYTFKKHVKKPNGAKPGMVIYENQKTLYITPDETNIRKLQSNTNTN